MDKRTGAGNDADQKLHHPRSHRPRGRSPSSLPSLLGSWGFGVGRWSGPALTWAYWNGHIQLLLWFTWPAWPLALYECLALAQAVVQSEHQPAPLVAILVYRDQRRHHAALRSSGSDFAIGTPRFLCHGCLCIAYPTRTSCGIDRLVHLAVLYRVWSDHLGRLDCDANRHPAQPAANVARLAPGYEASFQILPFLFALGATLAWGWLVRWRADVIAQRSGKAWCFPLAGRRYAGYC